MLRILTLPARHAYLDRVLPADAVRVAADRTGPDPHLDPLWDPARLGRVLPRADVVHVHFGFDHVEPAALGTWADTVRGAGRPLVVTVHDLRNPHHPDRRRHDEQLGILLSRAAAVLTLTHAAAAEIGARHGRAAVVVPHPAVFDGPAPVRREPGLVGLHLKSLRTNLVDLPAVVAATAAGAADAGGDLWVGAHHDVATAPALAAIRVHSPVRLHDRLDDAGLRTLLSRLHVLVLPQRFGTHSGLLEACRDVGTAVVAPRCGCYLQQWPAAFGYDHDERDGLSTGSLRTAVAAAATTPPPAPADRAGRDRQETAGRDLHARTYRDALIHRRAPTYLCASTTVA